MGAEQSQMSQVDAPTSQAQDEVFDPNSITSESDSDSKREKTMKVQRQSTPPSQPSQEIEEMTAMRNKKTKKGNRKNRRSSSTAKSVEDQTITYTPLDQNLIKSRPSTGEGQEDSRQINSDHDVPMDVNENHKSSNIETMASVEEYTIQENEVASMAEPTLPAAVNYPSLKVLDRSRSGSKSTDGGKRLKYPCPFAEKYDCHQTFALLSASRRHAQITHADSGQHSCPFCSKTFVRPDRLQAHKLAKHAAELLATEDGDSGIETEEAAAGSDELPRNSQYDNPHIEEGDAANEHGSQTLPDMMQRPVHIENQTSDAEEQANLRTRTLESLHEIPDSDPQYLVANDIPAAGTGNLEQSSSKSSISPDSVFDGPAEPMLIDSTPKPAKGLKRKRNFIEKQLPTPSNSAPKRRRRDVLSPPTSLTSEDDVPVSNLENTNVNARIRKPLKTNQSSSKPTSSKTGNLDAFAQPWAPGSQLYHPIHNPRSPRKQAVQQVQVIIPRSSQAGPSKLAPVKNLKDVAMYDLPNADDEQTPTASKIRRATYSSPKGKRNAEPGVDYSSPEKRPQAVEGDEEEEDDDVLVRQDEIIDGGEGGDVEDDEDYKVKQTTHNGIATSVAKRTKSQKSFKKAVNSRKKKKTGADDDDSGAGSEPADDGENGADGDIYLCQECKRKFQSRAALKKHENTKNVHDKLHQCEDCEKTFSSVPALAEHQKNTNHGDGTGYQGRKGHLSPGEVAKLERWRDRFCDEYDLNVSDFNQMMTDSCRRTKAFVWPHRFVTKQDFLQEYYDVLPNRNRRSMNRYRERNFQNVPQNQTWTQEDDNELVQLYKLLGPKWVEIGQRMTRTQDSVNQRWRHKLQYRGRAVDGEWEPEEAEQLIKAVNMVKRESNLPLDPDADIKMPWELVSKKMKLKRTAQQCSNKWRAMHLAKKDGRYVVPKATQQTPVLLSSSTTPSKMSRRLNQETPLKEPPKSASSSAKRKYTSEEHVHDTDDSEGDNEDMQVEKSESPDPSPNSYHDTRNAPITTRKRSKKGQPVLTSDVVIDTPTLPRNPPFAKTPRDDVGLSQVFNQTQANTSAPRLTTTARKQTQTQRPSPDVPMRLRPRSSPLEMINARNTVGEEHKGSDAEVDESQDRMSTDSEAEEVEDDKENSEEEEDEGGDEDEEAEAEDEVSNLSESGMIEEEAAEATTASEAESEGEDDEESESTSSSGETDEDQASDQEEQDISKNTFLRSLQSQPIVGSTAALKPITNSRKIDWMKAVRGQSQQGASSEEEESESSDDGEGDIMHH